MVSSFFATLNYSSCNEDWRTERRALQIGRGARVVCVTGSGDRPLHLLLDDPDSVVAVDANAAQGHLLKLKTAAMTSFPYRDYVGFLGLNPHDQREWMFDELAPRLDPDTRGYWHTERAAIRSGLLYAGRWERYYRRIARLSQSMRGKAIAQLFEFSDLDAQRAFVRDVWDRAWWRRVFDLLCSRLFSRLFLRDPAFYANVDPKMRIGEYIYDGMRASLGRFLARENFMLSLVFRGTLPADDLPPYLAGASFEPIRSRIGRIAVGTADIIDFLESAPLAAFTHFSLSDVPSYLDDVTFARLLRAVLHSAAPGARVCIREFLSRHPIPADIAPQLVRDTELEEELRRDDRAFAYRFIVGTVRS